MKEYKKNFEIKWADLDPNRHLRHTAYNDYAAHMRVCFLKDMGLPITKMEELNMGPILFREETKYLREVGMQDTVTISCCLLKMREDGSRWSFYHEVFRSDDVKAAEITVEGAWMDITKRKLTIPPVSIAEKMLIMPRAENFEMEKS